MEVNVEFSVEVSPEFSGAKKIKRIEEEVRALPPIGGLQLCICCFFQREGA